MSNPKISGISPGVGGVNKLIELTGSGFGDFQSNSQIIFSKGAEEIIIPESDITFWSANMIRCYVPEQITEVDNA